MSDFLPSCALDANRRGVRGCIVEPAMGFSMQSFRYGWKKLPERLMRLFHDWIVDTHASLRVFQVAICVDDPWPPDLLATLHCFRMFRLRESDVQPVLAAAERILELKLSPCRSHLLAFLATHDDLRYLGDTREIAAAWALQLARDHLFRAELHAYENGPLHSYWRDPETHREPSDHDDIPF